ncbi:hypothetical protein ENUP19_0341G0011 [Entamoeba nuttalli]|uniref:Bacterial surface antigen (D15) domain-containing protein n=2 Tax=Entamoeba nuttalli TaxID=412467 RepID=K2H022_ENTNP|nr:hypothetical protein ENU1_123090 [Entamoeba nuttalli P19]EKE39562.1 hypothetical protein ENU1_123090 [Entamoeba nuttalli P19]|eukprot:XP_008858098.1 hypothetical protein ENU1_123090 [Entamoeba nuttalli P19]
MKGIPSTTQRHFYELFKSCGEEEVIKRLEELKIIQMKKKSVALRGKEYEISKPITMKIGTSIDQSNNIEISGIGEINNYLESGIHGEIAMTTRIQGGKLTIPKPSFNIEIPYYFNKEMHLFSMGMCHEEYEETFPFVHEENNMCTEIKYQREYLSVTFRERCNKTTAKADNSLEGIPHEIIDGSNKMEYSIETTLKGKKKRKWIHLEYLIKNMIGVYNESLFMKPNIIMKFITDEWRRCWLTSQMHVGMIISPKWVRMSEYYYLGGNELRGFRNRGCHGDKKEKHLGGDFIATFQEMIHYRLPIGTNTSIFGYLNFGLLSFAKIQGKKCFDCINSSCGVGVSLNNIEFNFTYPLLYKEYDEKMSFQITTSF